MAKQYSGVKIKAVAITDDASSFGDALRVVAEVEGLNDDFILVRGDTITNIDFQDALKMHYDIKK